MTAGRRLFTITTFLDFFTMTTFLWRFLAAEISVDVVVRSVLVDAKLGAGPEPIMNPSGASSAARMTMDLRMDFLSCHPPGSWQIRTGETSSIHRLNILGRKR